MAIIFGLLLGIALLIGIYVFRSRCWLCPPHPFIWGHSALLEALPYPRSFSCPLKPKLRCSPYPALMSVANSARVHWTTEISLGP